MDGQYRLAVGVHGRHHAAGRKFFRVNNFQSEWSLWWTPGPFTFALGYNFTNTNFKSVNLGGGSESRHNENNKVEFISWWSF